MKFTSDQERQIRRAAEAARLRIDQFILLAVQSLAARFGVSVPDKPASPVQPFRHPHKSKGGRPPKSFGEMTRHVPTGNYARVCPLCRRSFRVDDDVIVYCSDDCEKRAQNRRHYIRKAGK